MKEYSAFPKNLVLLKPYHEIVSYPGHSLGVSYLSAKMQSVYSGLEATRRDNVEK